jgi:hypothetical protein
VISKVEIEQKQKVRYAVLRKLYELSHSGDEREVITPEHISRGISLNMNEVQDALTYLKGEGLVQSRSIELGVSITHLGVREVERGADNSKTPPQHLPAPIIQHFYGWVGAVQTGNQNTSQLIQSANALNGELLKLLDGIRKASENQPPPTRAEIEEHLGNLREEIAKPESDRKTSKLRAYGGELWRVTKNIADLASKVVPLLKLLGIGP